MKTNVSLGMIIVAMVILIAVTGISMAARPVPAGNESAVITVQTAAHVDGMFQARTDMALQESTGNLTPPLGENQQVSTVAYDENTMAINGETTYAKNTQIDTGNVNGLGSNLQTDRIVEFDGGDGGRMVSSEDVLVQTVATQTTTETGCCPWGTTTNTTLPAECETVIAGSKMDVSEVSAATSSDVRAISDSPGTTVALDYSIDAHGINQTPGSLDNAAVGSASAYVSASTVASTNGTAQGQNLEYHDVTSVDGLFDLAKDVSYSSAPN